MGQKPFGRAITREEFMNRRLTFRMIKHNIHQIDLWLRYKINDAQLKSNIKIDPKEILPSEPWPRPNVNCRG